MNIIHDNKVSGPNKSVYSGFTVLYDFKGSDAHYSFDFDPDYSNDEILTPCEKGQGFFCCHITPKCAAVLQSIPVQPNNDGERILHSLRHIISYDLAYVSLSNSNDLVHIIVSPMETKTQVEWFIDDFINEANYMFGSNLIEIDYYIPIGWYNFIDINSIQVEIVLAPDFKADQNPALMASFHPVLRTIMMNNDTPLIPDHNTNYFVSDQQEGVLGPIEIKIMSLMLSCNGMTLNNLVDMFPADINKVSNILEFLSANKYAMMDNHGVYRLTMDGRIVLSKAMSHIDRDFYD